MSSCRLVRLKRSGFSPALDDDEHLGAGTAAQTVLDHVVEVASLRRFAVDMGNYIADSDPRKVGGTAGHELPHHDPSVRQRDAVDADPAELAAELAAVPGRGGGKARSIRRVFIMVAEL